MSEMNQLDPIDIRKVFISKYEGDIQGQFWYCQDNDDAKHFGGKVSPVYQYVCCMEECVLDQNEKNYCKSCYSSYEEQYEVLSNILDEIDLFQDEEDKEDEKLKRQKEKDEKKANLKLYESGNIFRYSFSKEDLPQAKKVLKDLVREFGSKITYYQITDYTMFNEPKRYIEYTEEHRQTKDEYEEKMMARICLGRQIVYCLENYGKCVFSG